MAKYKAYPEYKDSGVEWLGAIPAHWVCTVLKRLCLLATGLTPPTNNEDNYADEGYPWIRPEDINENGPETQASKYVSDNGWKLLRHVEPNSTIICCIGTIGKCGYVREIVSTNQQITAATFRDSERFNFYLMQSARTQLEELATGNVLKILNSERLGTLNVVKVDGKEANIIAEFLDHETEKIDNLIEKQKQLIELLKEKRQAVISHAVTKGLNPNVPMKDSGVEWLGEVPEHWVIKRLKHISPKIGVGLVINPSTYTKDEGVYFIFGGDVKEFRFDLTKTRRISPQDSNKLLPSRLNNRDLVSVRVGYPGITSVVTDELDGSNCASIIIIRRGSYNSDWLCAAMNVWVGRQQVDLASYGAAQKQFNVSDAIEFVFPVPPISEQDDIANFVQKMLNKFDDLTLKALNQIDLLQERRTALISAAVTGKIDVRDWVAPDSSEMANIEESPEVNA
ncbi:restriction endonuclease subunit S [Pectobacterium aroidearum]|uniref:restriction endonuclease subunit S n=1 Tax=Pectobacterium aroidearum TaxID=1201031 RepID=UPI003314A522